MLELHKFKIAGDDVQTGDVSRSDDFLDRPAFLIVSKGAVDCFIRPDIKFRLVTEQGREAGLRVKIDRQNTITSKAQVLSKVRRSRCFS